MSKDKTKQKVLALLDEHTFADDTAYSQPLQESLLMELLQLIQDERKEAYKKGYSDGYIESHNLQMDITKQLTKGDN